MFRIDLYGLSLRHLFGCVALATCCLASFAAGMGGAGSDRASLFDVVEPERQVFSAPFDTSRIDHADMNGDGMADLVAIWGFGSAIRIWFNDGAGGWASEDIRLSSRPTDFALADENGDGHQDIFFTYGESFLAGVHVIHGLGDGSFGSEVLITPKVEIKQLEVADVDGDGALDLLLTRVQSVGFHYERQPDGTWQLLATLSSIPAFPRFLFLEDVNGDGLRDWILMTQVAMRVRLCTEEGVIGPVSYQADGSSFFGQDVGVVDLNQDGHLDIVMMTFFGNESPKTFLGDGTGDFTVGPDLRVGSQTASVAVRDLDGDGASDLVFADRGGGNVTVLRELGATPIERRFAVANRVVLLELMELDGDPEPELVTFDRGGNDISIVELDAAGELVGVEELLLVRFGARHARLADLNGDGLEDHIVTNETDRSVSVHLATGPGTFVYHGDVPTDARPREFVAGDFDGDGTPDLAVTSAVAGGAFTIMVGDGAGGFSAGFQVALPAGAADVVAEDLNGDGVADLLLVDIGGGIERLIGQGDGTFVRLDPLPIDGTPVSGPVLDFAMGDLDGDGLHDLVFDDRLDLRFRFGLPDGTFGSSTSLTTGGLVRDLELADLNADGILDLVNSFTGIDDAIEVRLGVGDGTFLPSTVYEDIDFARAFRFEDFDQDGKLDIAFLRDGRSDFGIIFGDGAGGAEDFVTWFVPGGMGTLAASDMDDDGRVDLMVGFRGAAVRLNRGGDAPCEADIDDSGAVDFGDLTAVLSAWGACPALCTPDIDGDGMVGIGDLLTVLARWGPC
ncbi:MAG: FG-GAP repeat domain-containing protein [Phycisphaerales bacterium]